MSEQVLEPEIDQSTRLRVNIIKNDVLYYLKEWRSQGRPVEEGAYRHLEGIYKDFDHELHLALCELVVERKAIFVEGPVLREPRGYDRH